MNKDAQMVAIARACGLQLGVDESGKVMGRAKLVLGGNVGHWDEWEPLPDYLNDLNACHEMEKVLTDKQRLTYGNWLVKLCGSWIKALSAEPDKKCEAFLRTIGQWHPSDDRGGAK